MVPLFLETPISIGIWFVKSIQGVGKTGRSQQNPSRSRPDEGKASVQYQSPWYHPGGWMIRILDQQVKCGFLESNVPKEYCLPLISE